MSDKDPFAEPDDADRTVIKPNPGGRRSLAPAPQTAAPQEDATRPEPAAAPDMQGLPRSGGAGGASTDPNVDQGMTGMNRINAAASTLFSLIGRIRNRAQHMDPDKLRRSVVAEVRAFENRALQAGVDAQDVKIARYAICATLDDVVLNTPWGGQSIWAQQSMVGTFHKETVGGDRFYDLLARLEKEPGKNIDLLECLYMCLSLGFEGRLRVEQNGSDKHLQIRAGLARIIRGQRGQVESELSPHWKGLDLPHKVRSIWKPLWITASVVVVLLTGTFMTLSYLLNNSTERVLGQLSVLDTGRVAELVRRAPPPPPPPPPPVEQVNKVKGFLEAEIDQGLVEVFQDNSTITIRIAGSNMFGSGSDRLEPQFNEPLERVAEALVDTSGPVIITGHSDNVPIRSSRFPSNMHLSLARAETVTKKLAGLLEEPERLKAEGRADKDPIASNDTREGRARNRRIEIILVREDAT
ncbi:MAG: type IVB secretion system protein IcmH/DotU [Pseudooceanicola sp.]